MAQNYIQIKVDEELKNDFTKLCSELGLTVTGACLVFMKTAVREQRIPFELTLKTSEAKEETGK